MQHPQPQRPPVAQLYPPYQRDALVRAAAAKDWRAIDSITDTLAAMGLCRRRDDDSQPQRNGWHA